MEVQAEYKQAVAAVTLIKNRGRLNADQIASEVGTTVGQIHNVMARLTLRGLINRKKGPGGGYEVNPDYTTISMGDVMECMIDKQIADFDEIEYEMVEALKGVLV